MRNTLLTLLLPIIVGPLAFAAMQALKIASATIDRLPVFVKRLVVAGIAVALTLVGNATGLNLHCDPNAGTTCLEVLDQDAVKAILGAGLAYALHWLKAASKRQKV